MVTCRTRAEAEHVLARAAKILEQLGVTLNRDKTRIVHVAHGFEFLGFKIKRGKRQFKLSHDRIKSKLTRQGLYAIPTQKSVDRFKDQIRALTKRRVPLRSDGVTFEAIEAQGVEAFLEQIVDELVGRSYAPLPARRQEIPKDGGKVRVLSIPAIRDRVAQGALKLILEPIFEADFQSGSFGYRPQRTAHEAVDRVARAIVQYKTRVIDIDLRSYFDNVRHDRLLAKVAQRVDDADVMHLLKIMFKASGKQGVPQGGVISPLLSNIYLTEVDRMLERAREATRYGKYTSVEYARFADDLVILIDAHQRHDWLMAAVEKRLREELAELQVEINEEKS